MMEIVKANYTGNYQVAVAENEVQERYAVKAVREILDNVGQELSRLSEQLASDERHLMDTERRVYLELRVMGLEKLYSRLADATAQVAGCFDQRNDA
ncbi:hypothetical protein [Vreelandella piezotolerans]|uniref:hypothetical protein n=1 Tax=Vreelandella piezotolerans TaxID=2609667 RepID=UPI003791AB30